MLGGFGALRRARIRDRSAGRGTLGSFQRDGTFADRAEAEMGSLLEVSHPLLGLVGVPDVPVAAVGTFIREDQMSRPSARALRPAIGNIAGAV